MRKNNEEYFKRSNFMKRVYTKEEIKFKSLNYVLGVVPRDKEL